mgnify:CR=1 FL=1
MRWAGTGSRLLLGLLFVVAGSLKAVDPDAFINDVDGYRMLWGLPLVVFSFFVPFFEVVAGAALLLRWPYRGAILAASGLLAVFLIALLQAWVRDLDISCGCFGRESGGTHYPWWVARDLILLAGCWLCWMDANRARTKDEVG